MKVIKVKKEHKEILKDWSNLIDGLSSALEVLAERLASRRKMFWNFIREEYPEVKKDSLGKYNKEKQQIIIYNDRTEYMIDEVDEKINN